MGEVEVIEPIVRAMASWTESSNDPGSQLEEQAQELALLLRDLVRCSAFALTAWDPTSKTHRHQTLASDGYTDATLAHVNDAFVKTNRAFELAHRNDPRSLRWRDYKRDWKFDFSDTFTAQGHLIPHGYKEGSTMCLRLPDGRYTGAIHMSWTVQSAATDDRRETTERFRPVLAALCDQLRAPRLLAEAMEPILFAVVFAANGSAYELPNRSPGPHLSENGSLRRLIAEKTPALLPRYFLWADDGGLCHRVSVAPCRGDVYLVAEEPVPWPHGLSPRELQVLHLVAVGASNPEIARQLFISPRTVSTHIEHLLDKMGCYSRTRLAAMAVAEGLCLALSPTTRG